MNSKTYCGTTTQILEQLKNDLNFRPMSDRLAEEGVTYPFNSDGCSDMTFAEQLDKGQEKVFWMEFVESDTKEVFGTLQSAKVRILKG